MRRGAPWNAVHLRWQSPADRLDLLVVGLAPLDGEGRTWFFVDCDREIELAVLGAPVPGVDDGGSAWHDPCALRDHLFPGGQVPAPYGHLLADTTRRALGPLRALRNTGRHRCPDAAVSTELGAIYLGLMPNADDRRGAMQQHAAWLDRVADRAGLDPTELSTLDPPAPPPDITPALERWRGALRSATPPNRDGTAYGMVVARLAHAQAVRLWGGGDDELRREAWLVRGLAAAT